MRARRSVSATSLSIMSIQAEVDGAQALEDALLVDALVETTWRGVLYLNVTALVDAHQHALEGVFLELLPGLVEDLLVGGVVVVEVLAEGLLELLVPVLVEDLLI